VQSLVSKKGKRCFDFSYSAKLDNIELIKEREGLKYNVTVALYIRPKYDKPKRNKDEEDIDLFDDFEDEDSDGDSEFYASASSNDIGQAISIAFEKAYLAVDNLKRLADEACKNNLRIGLEDNDISVKGVTIYALDKTVRLSGEDYIVSEEDYDPGDDYQIFIDDQIVDVKSVDYLNSLIDLLMENMDQLLRIRNLRKRAS